ncbi:RNA-binding S4 domain protein [Methylocella silvestris BL2]|uniref:Pseudouridine synthase n=1 Tax=Methylocella silvestris (strain DSM 15510 / CIP 108128 / LMG 27833 / NCIMB 13906 / BL2) TaxID=395965 RepID=B8ETE9_METSB|nr:pseudouridine synthase [Methylocella silvestris]ACK51791.1 RNA-binding S4 domain protein [Methylocella silvestris BL2]
MAPLVEKPRPAKAQADAAAPDAAPERIAKVIARAGACSRRDAETLISEGRVALNGAILISPAINVGPDDVILIDGAPLAERARTRLFLFHKPRGLVTTEHDPEGRPTVFDYVREHSPEAPRLVSIGRLDINTEGLLLLTNDGGLARVLELPATGWARRYRVRAKGSIDQPTLDRLRQGVTVEGVDYAQIEATLDRIQGANCWLTMSLREGKNREIKRVLEHLGLEVNRLIRLSYGPFQLADLEEGKVEEVRTRVLRDQLGAALAEAAAVDFVGPAGDALTPPPEEPAPRPPRQKSLRNQKAFRDEERPRRDSGPFRKAEGGGRPAGAGLLARRRGPDPAAFDPAQPRKNKPAPGPRKHISSLRAEASEPGAGRTRIERSETADRSGRAVAVERRVAAKVNFREEAAPRPKTAGPRPARESAERDRRAGRSQAREEAPPRLRDRAAADGGGRRRGPDRAGGAEDDRKKRESAGAGTEPRGKRATPARADRPPGGKAAPAKAFGVGRRDDDRPRDRSPRADSGEGARASAPRSTKDRSHPRGAPHRAGGRSGAAANADERESSVSARGPKRFEARAAKRRDEKSAAPRNKAARSERAGETARDFRKGAERAAGARGGKSAERSPRAGAKPSGPPRGKGGPGKGGPGRNAPGRGGPGGKGGPSKGAPGNSRPRGPSKRP